MALTTKEVKCTTCGQTKKEKRESSDRTKTCNDCKQDKLNKKRQKYLDTQSDKPLIYRLKDLEEQMFDLLNPPIK